MSDELDRVAALAEREAERFAAALKAQRERPLPIGNFCLECGEILAAHRRPFARCFYCASKREHNVRGVARR
ncbi:MAG: hypothetical protein KAX46_03100 [Chromatiaceae bacterium]|nr:hypothetical protein [Chromatiaceae bacterium]